MTQMNETRTLTSMEHRKNSLATKIGSSKQGSSTLEFIFCAPLLVMFMFVAMELNERVEQRINSSIAANNTAWLAKADLTNVGQQSAIEPVTKADILGIKSGSTSSMILNGSSQPISSGAILSYSDSKMNSNAYHIMVNRRQNSAATATAANRASTAIGTSVIDQISSNLAAGSAQASQFFDQITGGRSRFLPTIFPNNDVEEITIGWSLTNQGSSNKALEAIDALSKQVNGSAPTDMNHFYTSEYRVLAHHTVYLRRDPAYHPNSYKNQAVLGMVLGSSDFSDFNNKCFMKLDVDDAICGEKNKFADYLHDVYMIISGGKTAIDLFTSSCLAATAGLGSAGCLATKIIVGEVEDAIKDAIDHKITSEAGKIATMATTKVEDFARNALPGGSITDSAVNNIKTSIHQKTSEATTEYLRTNGANHDETP
ncbi:MAG: pilus assembly protein [Proteobacteria bacterium]|nr:pilus assembly protein [Pseudomonadota bacterium]